MWSISFVKLYQEERCVLGLPVCVEKQAVCGRAPGVGVTHTPDGDGYTGGNGEAGLDDGLVVIGGGTSDVELCNDGLEL